MSTLSDLCVFCDEARDPSRALEFLPEEWPYRSRVLYVNEETFVVPGLGPQVYPYALVISRRHFTSFGLASRQERKCVLDSLRYLLALGVYPSGELQLFEHGGCGLGGSACIEHFHLHVVDSAVRILQAFERKRGDAKRVVISEELALRGGEQYLFVGTFDGQGAIRGLKAEATGAGRQYFRREIARLTGGADWDWRWQLGGPLMLRFAQEVLERRRGEISSTRDGAG